jgi:hypothetical protein
MPPEKLHSPLRNESRRAVGNTMKSYGIYV